MPKKDDVVRRTDRNGVPVKPKSKGHKYGQREATAKKQGWYPHGHKNYGDVYEA